MQYCLPSRPFVLLLSLVRQLRRVPVAGTLGRTTILAQRRACLTATPTSTQANGAAPHPPHCPPQREAPHLQHQPHQLSLSTPHPPTPPHWAGQIPPPPTTRWSDQPPPPLTIQWSDQHPHHQTIPHPPLQREVLRPTYPPP